MKRLLQLTTLLEAPTGLALIIEPAFVVRLLLRAEISGAAFPLGRIAGLAVLGLGVACWLASYNPESCAARGVVSAMVIYNLGTTLVLGGAGVHSPPGGIALWPVVILHAALGIWCVASLLSRKAQTAN
jgi:hypothetical protein